MDDAAIRSLAAELGFEVDDETVESVLAAARDLHEDVESQLEPAERRESVGHRSGDPYNALLDVYDDPRSGSESGPLADLTLAVKDSIAVRDLEATVGCAAFSYVPTFDAVVTERLLDAGADVAGKANLESFAFGITGENSDFGRVENPTHPGRVPGGSSSGSAAAVAGGLVDAAIGTDAGGSIRIPSACCGLTGIKPTHGLVPRHGLVDFAPAIDTIGPIAHDVETCSQILDTLAGFDRRDPSSARVEVGDLTAGLDTGADLTFGVPDALLEPATAPVREEMLGLADRLGDAGATVESVDLDLGAINTAYFVVSAAEFAWVGRQNDAVRGQGTGYEEQLRAAFQRATEAGITSENLVRRVLPGAAIDAATDGRAYAWARRETIRFQRALDDCFADVDLLLCPTLRRLPPEFGDIRDLAGTLSMLGNTSIFNLSGNPGVAVPAGEREGLTVSAQVVGPEYGDADALRGARLVERVS